ncbi:MAG TPA: trypsin-like peptidase domain-containing protein [Gaiellaceae bacterium]|nr:trypsin-like peptidase domain-containing protein [Gaiellaceae bacterium]
MARTRNRVVAAVAAAALAGGAVGAIAVSLTSHSRTTTVRTVAPANSANIASSSTLTVAEIAKKWSSSVVELTVDSRSSNSPFPGSSGSSTAEGSGFVYDTKGDIVTNQHVVEGAASISVRFRNGSTYKGTLVGQDPSTDVAVVHVNAPVSLLVPVTLGDSSAVQIGEGVVAIGDPYGLVDTVTSGIVSATGREIQAPDGTPIENAIQTDAPINHGNSGGPLLDMQGDVIGITSQIQSDSGVFDGIGFAVPSNLVAQIALELVATGTAKHAEMGVFVGPAANGARVSRVRSGSGAARAGIQLGDVITSVGGVKVTTPQRLRALIEAHQPGDTVQVTILRAGATRTLAVTLGNRTS